MMSEYLSYQLPRLGWRCRYGEAVARRAVVVERTSTVPRDAAEVWARVTTPAGIRAELLPWLSMTTPPGLRGRNVGDAADVLGQPLGKAWLLLFGVLPVDYDDMTIVGLVPGRSFHERSRMMLLSPWEHERTVTPTDGGCVVHDRLTFVPRLGVVGPVARRIVGALFGHRHRRLLRWATQGRQGRQHRERRQDP